MRRRWPAAGGVVGPLTFVAAWAVLGATAEGYDPVRQAISRLAAVGASTRPAMTLALVVLGAGMVMFGLALRSSPAWPMAVVNGLAAVAVAALPLGDRYDTAHGVAAAMGYVTLAGIPLAMAGERRLPVLVALASGGCLLASVLVTHDGLFQRMGLTIGHGWIVVSALGLLRGHSSSDRPPRCLARNRSAAA